LPGKAKDEDRLAPVEDNNEAEQKAVWNFSLDEWKIRINKARFVG
jgi:hypothetical protein